MFKSIRRGSIVAAIGTCAVLAGPIAGAEASNASIVATMKSYNAKIEHDEAGVLNGLADYNSGKAAPLEKALRHEVTDIKTLTGKLKQDTASTTAGARGRTEIIKGLGMIAKSYSALATEVQKSSAGKPVPKSKVKATIKVDKQGRAELTAGLKLVGA